VNVENEKRKIGSVRERLEEHFHADLAIYVAFDVGDGLSYSSYVKSVVYTTIRHTSSDFFDLDLSFCI